MSQSFDATFRTLVQTGRTNTSAFPQPPSQGYVRHRGGGSTLSSSPRLLDFSQRPQRSTASHRHRGRSSETRKQHRVDVSAFRSMGRSNTCQNEGIRPVSRSSSRSSTSSVASKRSASPSINTQHTRTRAQPSSASRSSASMGRRKLAPLPKRSDPESASGPFVRRSGRGSLTAKMVDHEASECFRVQLSNDANAMLMGVFEPEDTVQQLDFLQLPNPAYRLTCSLHVPYRANHNCSVHLITHLRQSRSRMVCLTAHMADKKWQIRVFKRNGSSSVLSEIHDRGMAFGKRMHVELHVSGNVLSVWVNDVAVFDKFAIPSTSFDLGHDDDDTTTTTDDANELNDQTQPERMFVAVGSTQAKVTFGKWRLRPADHNEALSHKHAGASRSSSSASDRENDSSSSSSSNPFASMTRKHSQNYVPLRVAQQSNGKQGKRVVQQGFSMNKHQSSSSSSNSSSSGSVGDEDADEMLQRKQEADAAEEEAKLRQKQEATAARRRRMAYDGPNRAFAEEIETNIIERDLGVRFEDIAGLEDAKKLLNESCILPSLMPEFFTGIRQPWKGILLFGPPGTGKTMLAKAVASMSGTTFFGASASSLLSKYRGDSEKMVSTLFQMARAYAPSTIFLDEIDAVLGNGSQDEHEATRRFKAQFLQELDGLTSSNADDGVEQRVVLLATTNSPWLLDEAMRRRLEKRIYCPLPDEAARRTLLLKCLEEVELEDDVDMDVLVERTEHMSGADIRLVCRDASFRPLRRLMESMSTEELVAKRGNGKVTRVVIRMDDLLEALGDVKGSVNASELERFEQFQKDFGSR